MSDDHDGHHPRRLPPARHPARRRPGRRPADLTLRKGGHEDARDTFNHFSLLKTIEDLFSVKHLGYAEDASLPEFDSAIFNDYTAG